MAKSKSAFYYEVLSIKCILGRQRKIDEIFKLFLNLLGNVKKSLKISSNFLAFTECKNHEADCTNFGGPLVSLVMQMYINIK